MCLPENYELIAGTKFDNIHLYYELIKVTAVDTAHGIKSILKVPLKPESQHFTLSRIIALPTRILNVTFALYQLEYNYFGLSHRDYILMTAADVQKCDAGSITICPADRALYEIRSITYKSKLYFQTTTKDGPYKRSLMLHETYLVAARKSIDLPFPEPASSDHQVPTGQRMGDTYSNTFRRRINPQSHTVLNHFRRDTDAPGTTRRRAR